MTDVLLEVQALTTGLSTDTGDIRPVDNVSFALSAGETLTVVGESGSGKSMLAFTILRLLPNVGRIESGAILWKGKDVVTMGANELRRMRGGEIALVFQEAGSALNPVRTVGDQLARAAQDAPRSFSTRGQRPGGRAPDRSSDTRPRGPSAGLSAPAQRGA